MNKTTFILCLAFGITTNASSQSTFGMVNYIRGVLDVPVFDGAGQRLNGTNFLALLYGGPTMDALTPTTLVFSGPLVLPVPFNYMPSGQPGYFSAPGSMQVNSVEPGAVAWLQVRAWDARLGATYEDVVALGIGGYGGSNLFQERGGDPTLGVPILPSPLYHLQSFSLLPVIPEPSPALLLLLGLPAAYVLKQRVGYFRRPET
jgi:hypothetical protein